MGLSGLVAVRPVFIMRSLDRPPDRIRVDANERAGMTKILTISANGIPFSGRAGEILLDCALRSGVDYPHDCRAGRCGSCLTRVVSGATLGGESLQRGMVHACRARVLGDAEVTFEKLPTVVLVKGSVRSLIRRGYDVTEVRIDLDEPLNFHPGQYCKFKFRGYPERPFSPTWPADGSRRSGDLVLHVKRVRDGLVSNALGNEISAGHPVTVEGPFGSAFYRPDNGQRLVLVCGGTGFAPILSIAMAALADDPLREIHLVVGTRKIDQLYMVSCLTALRRFPGIRFTVTAAEVPEGIDFIRQGTPADFIPDLTASDVVYAAGAPTMVTRVAGACEVVGAEFHCDPFDPAQHANSRTLADVRRKLGDLFRRQSHWSETAGASAAGT